ncbi:MAG: hypothetical protein K2M98_05005, partial [Muribaculum sp.]|nr:hypothetical protein [Muribaculum sp.]
DNKGHLRAMAFLCLLLIVMPSLIFGRANPRVPDPPVRGRSDVPVYSVAPSIPSADRKDASKVFLEHADRLWMDDRINADYQVLTGNVQFRKGDMFMYCDSAHFYDKTGSMDAFGNVHMEQGDTLFVYAAELNYDGPGEMAVFYGDNETPVRLINKDVELSTDVFHYDFQRNLGYYDVGGQLSDAENILTSIYGEYQPDTKDAEFRIDVFLKDQAGEKFTLNTERLLYNTDTRIARIVSPSVIVTDSATVYSSNGVYITDSSRVDLFDRSMVKTPRGSTLTADTLFYDTETSFGEGFGNVVITDSVRQSALEGDYGYLYEKLDSGLVTGHARALEYSRGDTLYLHGDTVRGYIMPEDSTHIISVYHNVRFWRVDMQGICDSLAVLERDSVMYMHRHPIVWNGLRQIFGNLIMVHFNDSTADWAKLPDYGFVAEHIEDYFYNQLTGREMDAEFVGGDLRRLDVIGNVEAIFLPQENDSTYNKIVRTESSTLKAFFDKRHIERMTMWPEVSGTVTPLYLSKRSECFLDGFQWYDMLRPVDKDDIFNVSKEMIELMSSPPVSARKRNL